MLRSYIINRHHGGDLTAFGLFLRHYGLRGMWSVWPVPWGAKGAEAWLWVVAFGAVQALMQVVVPGKTFHGPISPKGNVPVYKARCVGPLARRNAWTRQRACGRLASFV